MADLITGELILVRFAVPDSDEANGEPRLISARRFLTGAHPLVLHDAAGADGDADLLEVLVTGSPKFQWNEAGDIFKLTKGLGITGALALSAGLTATTISGTTLSGTLLNLSAVSDGAAANQLGKDGIPKAWAHVDQTGTQAILDEMNVSGLTDDGTGQTTLSWDRDFSGADAYAVSVVSQSFSAVLNSPPAAASCAFRVRTSGATNVDDADVMVLALGRQT